MSGAPRVPSDRPGRRHRLAVRVRATQLGLASLMNTTRWHRLQRAIDTLPFAPPYQRKDLLHDAPQPQAFEADVHYLGDWSDEALAPLCSIEWLRIRPRVLEHVAMRLPPRLIDCEAALLAALRLHRIPHSCDAGSVWVHGYR